MCGTRDCQLPNSNCQLRITSYQLRITNFELQKEGGNAGEGGGPAAVGVDGLVDLGHEADGFVQGDDDARHKGEGITSYELPITNYKGGMRAKAAGQPPWASMVLSISAMRWMDHATRRSNVPSCGTTTRNWSALRTPVRLRVYSIRGVEVPIRHTLYGL